MNVLVYLPDDETIRDIAQKMEHSFALRIESSKLINNIVLN